MLAALKERSLGAFSGVADVDLFFELVVVLEVDDIFADSF